MPDDGSYTVASLIESLSSLEKYVSSASESLSWTANTVDPTEDQSARDGDDAYSGLRTELDILRNALLGLLYLLRITPPPPEASHAALNSPPPILDSCEDMVRPLTTSEPRSLSPEAVLDARSKTLWFQRTISNAASWVEKQHGLLLYLSLLPPRPSRDFQLLEVPAARINHWRSMKRTWGSTIITADTVSYWLELLNATFNDREPDEYHTERTFVGLRSQAIPEYSTAAADWPLHAERFWSILRPQIFSLFNPSKSFNFVQWVLEFARMTWPAILGDEAPSAEPLIDLTDALCSGSISPLHVAAALGLPSLCRDLLSGSDINMASALGAPITCALLGWDAFVYQHVGTWSWPRDATYANRDRAATILLLLDSGADCKHSFEFEGEQASIMSLGFWASFAMENESILRKIETNGAQFDSTLVSFLQYPEVHARNPEEKDLLSRLLTYLLDSCIQHVVVQDLLDGALSRVIQDTMKREGVDFPSVHGFYPMERIRHQQLHDLTWSVLLSGSTFEFRRLTLDPRFDPSGDFGQDGDGDTLLHSAVGDDSIEMVDILMEAGADLGALDYRWRTPVMLAESVEMLERLVLRYGATTTSLDIDGRNIWHFAAASNDIMLLTWLCENDPWKLQNIYAVTDNGSTPLAEALLFIETLPTQPIDSGPLRAPLAARKLLKECTDDAALKSPVPLTHLAAAWGDVELIEGLVALGADFEALNEDGETAIYHLNFSASVQVVQRLQELCGGRPVESAFGLTPAETIFDHFRTTFDDGGEIRSQHPSCKQLLSGEAYSLLLNPATVHHIDWRGEGLWPRFYRNVICANVMPTGRRQAKPAAILHDSIVVALRCIIRAGALKVYEEQHGKSAVFCFLGKRVKETVDARGSPGFYHDGSIPSWNVEYLHPFILLVLRNSGASVLEDFYRSRDAMGLLGEAGVGGNMRLVKHLCCRGVPPTCEGDTASGTPLELVIEKCEGADMLTEMLTYVTREQVKERQFALMNALLKNKERGPLQKLRVLFDKGMDPRAVPSGNTWGIFGSAVLARREDVVISMMDLGADPRIGEADENIAIVAARVGCELVVSEIIRRFGADFPWLTIYDVGPGPTNILLTAALFQHDRIIELLLEKTELSSHVNDIVGSSTAAHAATTVGSVKCLKALIRNGADLTVSTPDGYTPLHLACTKPNSKADVDTVKFLVKAEPRAAKLKGREGKTPLDLATQLGHPECIEVLERFDLERHLAEGEGECSGA